MDLPESERTELPIELFEKIRRTIENLIQSHKQSWKNHRSDTNDESPVIGMGLRLHTVEEGNVDQFNAHYWNRPKKTYSLHGMKELSEITFFIKNLQVLIHNLYLLQMFILYIKVISLRINIRIQHQFCMEEFIAICGKNQT